MPAEGIPLKPHCEILSYESIALIASCAGRLGFKKIRLTGGEPLVKRNIESLVEMISLTGKYTEITMTTNGALLTVEKAKLLKKNGLTRINISLDTLDPERFTEITRGGAINEVFAGIEAAKGAELFPIKINMILFAKTTPGEINVMRSFCEKNGLTLQTIKHFSLYNRENESNYPHTFDRPQPCEMCNRLRLTADGYFKSCLFSDKETKVDLNNIDQSIREAVKAKSLQGTACVNRMMCQIGG
jgi:cyclic pyranopterin phosphate synthase